MVISSAPVGPCSVRSPIRKKNRPNAISAASTASLSAAASGRPLRRCEGAVVIRNPVSAPNRPHLHTFSTSGRPRMPVGRKISTMIRIENAATSLYSIEK